jgi:hypothetical protein
MFMPRPAHSWRFIRGATFSELPWKSKVMVRSLESFYNVLLRDYMHKVALARRMGRISSCTPTSPNVHVS